MAKDEIKVLMLAGHYVPNLGYQENGWVKALTLFGVRTKVVAPAYCIPTFRGLVGHTQCHPGTQEINGYELQYVPYYLNFRSMTWPRGIKAIIREFAPIGRVSPYNIHARANGIDEKFGQGTSFVKKNDCG